MGYHQSSSFHGVLTPVLLGYFFKTTLLLKMTSYTELELTAEMVLCVKHFIAHKFHILQSLISCNF